MMKRSLSLSLEHGDHGGDQDQYGQDSRGRGSDIGSALTALSTITTLAGSITIVLGGLGWRGDTVSGRVVEGKVQLSGNQQGHVMDPTTDRVLHVLGDVVQVVVKVSPGVTGHEARSGSVDLGVPQVINRQHLVIGGNTREETCGLEGRAHNLGQDLVEECVDGRVLDDQLGDQRVVGLEVVIGLVRGQGRGGEAITERAIKICGDPLPFARGAEGGVKVQEVVGTGHPVSIKGTHQVFACHVAQESIQIQTGVVPVSDGVSGVDGVKVLKVQHELNQLIQGSSRSVVAEDDVSVRSGVIAGVGGSLVNKVSLIGQSRGVHLQRGREREREKNNQSMEI